MRLRNPVATIGALLGVYVLWGSTLPAMRVTVQTLPPFLMAAIRFLLAGAILYGFALARGAERPSRAQWRSAGITAALLLLLGNGVVAACLTVLPSGIGALLVSVTPIWMALIDYLFLGAKLTAYVAGGMALGLAGVALLVHPWARLDFPLLPMLVLLASSVAWAAGSIYQRRAAFPANLALGTGMQMLCGSALLFPAALVTGELRHFHPAAVSPVAWFGVAYLVLFGAVAAYTCYTWLLRNAPTPLVSTYAYVNPLVALAIGASFLHERITPQVLLAAGVVIAGVAGIVVAMAAEPSETEVLQDICEERSIA